jgi:hypothetical protein
VSALPADELRHVATRDSAIVELVRNCGDEGLRPAWGRTLDLIERLRSDA